MLDWLPLSVLGVLVIVLCWQSERQTKRILAEQRQILARQDELLAEMRSKAARK
jgi:hypothetical protein